MKYEYETERGLIINALSEEIGELAQEIERERETNGFTAQYRALSKTYNDATKHYLNLVKEVEAENAAEVDPLKEFNTPSPYDEDGRGLLVI
jgi:NTP pyrophosphatase (non-canonical NTP hydrolase)